MNDNILYVENSNCTNYNLNKSYQNNIYDFFNRSCSQVHQIKQTV